MKNRYKSIASFFCFILVLFVSLNIISKIFIPKWTENKDANMTNTIQGFYKLEKNSLDVLFLGDSSAYRGISPLAIWQNSKISSYVYGSPAQRTWLGYYMLKHALEYQSPKVVVLEASEMLYGKNVRSGYTRKVLDNMRWGPTKIEALLDPSFSFSLDKQLSYIFPIFEYHNRYNDIQVHDITNAFHTFEDNNKGYAINKNINPYKGKDDFMKKKYEFKIPKKSKLYADKIVDLCKKKNISLVLVNIPKATDWTYAEHDTIKRYADEKHLPFIDLNTDMKNSKIDWRTDTIDQGVHLNISGAEKVSAYLTTYLTDKHPNLANNRKSKKTINQYDAALKNYLKEKHDKNFIN